ncbi:WG repeat-containing protein [Anabaena sp. CCY 0017]|uniref:WG repeat-containing protein n=1 Tax=Anabaena sp. CCY 0017 TaxID=3103866 RepID=UPI0039C5EE8C
MSNSLIPFTQADKWGYKNQKGEVIIQAIFDQAGKFYNGIAQVKIGNQINYIDQKGRVKPVELSNISDNTAINLTDITNLNLELSRFKYREKYGYKNKIGQVIIPPQFNLAYEFAEGLASVKLGYKWVYIKLIGEVVINYKFDLAESFSQGLARVKIGKKYGYIDLLGSFVIPVKYDYIENFSENLAAVKVGKKWGYINLSGKVIINPQFDAAEIFEQGIAKVRIGNKHEYIDCKGKKINDVDSNIMVKELPKTPVIYNHSPLTPSKEDSQNLHLLHTRRRKRKNTSSG